MLVTNKQKPCELFSHDGRTVAQHHHHPSASIERVGECHSTRTIASSPLPTPTPAEWLTPERVASTTDHTKHKR